MKRIQPYLLILATLLIGLVLGVLLAGRFYAQRVDQLARMGRPEGFRMHFIERLELSPEQRAQIEPVLDRYFVKIRNQRRRMRSLHDSLRMEIAPLLTEEQRKAFERQRRFRPPHPPGMPGGPGPRGPRPGEPRPGGGPPPGQ